VFSLLVARTARATRTLRATRTVNGLHVPETSYSTSHWSSVTIVWNSMMLQYCQSLRSRVDYSNFSFIRRKCYIIKLTCVRKSTCELTNQFCVLANRLITCWRIDVCVGEESIGKSTSWRNVNQAKLQKIDHNITYHSLFRDVISWDFRARPFDCLLLVFIRQWGPA